MNREDIDGYLGKTYKDKISGFQGVATGFCRYLTGCDQVLLSSTVCTDGHTRTLWTDVQRLEEAEGE